MSLRRHANNWTLRLHRGRLLLVFLTLACVLTLTHMPPEAMAKTLPQTLQVGDAGKLENALAYALITMSFLFAVKWPLDRRLWIIIVLDIAGIGATDEITQPFVHRTCDVWAWTADVIEIALACVVLPVRNIVTNRWRVSSQPQANSVERRRLSR